ncbi:MAG: hypothetical protein ABIP20_19545 [Chthoniobacteraceae bacterium]
MKKLIFTLTLAMAFAVGSPSAFAQAKKKKDAAAEEATAAADKTKAAGDKAKAAAETGAAAAEKPKAAEAAKPKKDTIPMYVRADEIDAKAKTITQVNKDGKKGVNTVTSTTEIKNGEAAAKFEDIKKGDMVAGLRKKTGENAYEVVKITKFGPKAEKTEKPAGEPKKK